MTEYINRRLSSFTLTPEAPQRTFRITALVAPTSKESPTPNLTFKKPPFLGTIRETVTFDIEHDKLPVFSLQLPRKWKHMQGAMVPGTLRRRLGCW
ncbi:hypothetical protein Ptr902_14173 [Pyrenophora tritici-repentis]|nr:hypothetical protein Ptr902_14173 [Pyrenophora tritici-repentis]